MKDALTFESILLSLSQSNDACGDYPLNRIYTRKHEYESESESQKSGDLFMPIDQVILSMNILSDNIMPNNVEAWYDDCHRESRTPHVLSQNPPCTLPLRGFDGARSGETRHKGPNYWNNDPVFDARLVKLHWVHGALTSCKLCLRIHYICHEQ